MIVPPGICARLRHPRKMTGGRLPSIFPDNPKSRTAHLQKKQTLVHKQSFRWRIRVTHAFDHKMQTVSGDDVENWTSHFGDSAGHANDRSLVPSDAGDKYGWPHIVRQCSKAIRQNNRHVVQLLWTEMKMLLKVLQAAQNLCWSVNTFPISFCFCAVRRHEAFASYENYQQA